MTTRAEQIAQARKAGYSEAQIIAHLAKTDPKVAQAKSAGYNDAQIVSYLSKEPAAPKAPARKQSFGERALNYAGGAVANFNSQIPFLQDIEAGIQTVARDPVNAFQSVLPYAPGLNQSARNQLAPVYQEERQKIRDNNQRFDKEAPYVAASARGAGMGATLFVPGPKAANALIQPITATTTAGKVAQIGGNAARSGTAAAVSGAVYGLGGQGETAGQRIDDAATNALYGFGVGGLIGAAASRGPATPKPKRQPTPSVDQMKADTRAAYRAVDDMGVRYKPEALDDFIAGVGDEVRASSISPTRHPKAYSMLEDIEALKGSSPTLTELDQLRQVIRRDVANATDDAEKLFGQKMIQNLDEFIDSTTQAQVLSGEGAEGARAITAARGANTRLRKVEAVNEAVEKATNRSATAGSGGNVNNAIRQNLRTVLEKTRNLTPQERAALQEIVRGSKTQNVLRQVGKLSPQGNGLMLAGHLAAAPMTGGGSAVVAGLGAGSKFAADRMTQQKVANLVNLMATGGKGAISAEQELAAMAANDPGVQRVYQDVAAHLMRGVGAASATAMSGQ